MRSKHTRIFGFEEIDGGKPRKMRPEKAHMPLPAPRPHEPTDYIFARDEEIAFRWARDNGRSEMVFVSSTHDTKLLVLAAGDSLTILRHSGHGPHRLTVDQMRDYALTVEGVTVTIVDP